MRRLEMVWLYSLRNTGFLLAVFGVALLLGVWDASETQFQPSRDHICRNGDIHACSRALALVLEPAARGRENDEGDFSQVKGDCAVSRVRPNYFGAAPLR